MNEIRFRNHFSIVAETLGKGLVWIVIFSFQNILELIELLSDVNSNKDDLISILIFMGIVVAITLIMVVSSLIVWYKTTYIITDSAFNIERNIITHTKNSYKIENISNINIERNFFEMIIGTSRLKIDSDNLTTADSTDIEIVLKKDYAEQLKEFLLKRIDELKNDHDEISSSIESSNCDVQKIEVENDSVDYTKDNVFQIILHGLCSTSILGTTLIAFAICATITTFLERFLPEELWEGSLVVIILIGIYLLSYLIIMFTEGLFKFYNFKAGRKGEYIYVSYGLFRKFNFSIPVSRISGIIIKQTLTGRLFRRYSVDIINVGMGDEKEEFGSCVILASKKDRMYEKIRILLPEFADVNLDKVERQPARVLCKEIVEWLVFSGILAVVALVVDRVFIGIRIYIIVVYLILRMLSLMLIILSYCVKGTYMGDDEIVYVNGSLAREITAIKNRKIQYITLNSTPITRRMGIVSAHIRILSGGLLGSIKVIPYCKTEKWDEFISEKYLIR